MEQLKLHWLERQVLDALKRLGGRAYYAQLAQEIGKDEGTVAKVSSWLTSKGLASVQTEIVRKARLGYEGVLASREGLPERRLVNMLTSKQQASIDELKDALKGLFNIAVMWAKKKGWVEIRRDGDRTFVYLSKMVPEKGLDERVLRLLSKGPLRLDELPEDARLACLELSKRAGVVEIFEEKKRILSLTEEGMRIEIPEPKLPEVTQLTSDLLVTGRWREVKLSKFDIRAPTKPLFAGKRHPLKRFIKLVKQVFVELGFEEIRGPLVELAFWNYDALFVPQDHPARDMWDTFYLSSPSKGYVPKDIAEKVKATHENGGETGSLGWRYRWDEEEARRLLLRTHTTATTIRHVAANRHPPVKVFSIDRVYRNERTDWKHLAELHQIEGIVMAERAGLRDLMGIVREFCYKLGIKKVHFRPAYFPFTEPSAEALVYLENLGQWLELVGMGIFRPEVTLPLGVKHPVLAWGGGLERLAMAIMGLNDIRMFYVNDLSWIRGEPVASVELKRR